MHFSNTLHSFLLLFSFATALPTDMSSITQSASIANNHLTLETRDGFCSPKCKQQFDDLQSWRWISYSMLINEYNIKVRLYVSSPIFFFGASSRWLLFLIFRGRAMEKKVLMKYTTIAARLRIGRSRFGRGIRRMRLWRSCIGFWRSCIP